MSNTWFRFYDDALNDPKVQKLSPVLFKERFYACINGEINDFSSFIKGEYTRDLSNEWKIIRLEIFKRDNYTCQYCGIRGGKLECDHIIPVSRDGKNNYKNLNTSCFKCNRSKRAKLLYEWRNLNV